MVEMLRNSDKSLVKEGFELFLSLLGGFILLVAKLVSLRETIIQLSKFFIFKNLE